jgi:carbamoyltransferase
MTQLGISVSHNAALAFYHEGQYLVVELERFLGIKNAGLVFYVPLPDPVKAINDVIRYAEGFFSTQLRFENLSYVELIPGGSQILGFLKNTIPADRYSRVSHHEAHSAAAFYESPFDEALVISFDGGADDGFFRIFTANRSGSVTPVATIDMDLGFPYMLLGHYLKNVKQESDLAIGNLVYAGKVMGLCGYGKVREEWLPFLNRFYRGQSIGGTNPNDPRHQYRLELPEQTNALISDLEKHLNVPLGNRLDGAVAYDLIATSQRTFEDIFFEHAEPFITQYAHLPICLSGGCALNIVLNTAIRQRYGRPVFVPPNPNDCGIALGALLHQVRPATAMEAMYSGIPLLDGNLLKSVTRDRPHVEASPQEVARQLAERKILGIARGRSEHGPRALGNRSIMCDPAIPHVKDYLHRTIKKRERFRPFAPVVRAEDASVYFDLAYESPYMSFLATVRPEWQKKLAAITHVDNTARVQTVTASQNPWLHELLGHFQALTGHGVLLNTSFNVDSSPILSTIREALNVLDTTCLDGLVIEDKLFLKES